MPGLVFYLFICLCACIVVRSAPGERKEEKWALTAVPPSVCISSKSVLPMGHCIPPWPKSNAHSRLNAESTQFASLEAEEAMIMQKVAAQVIRSLKSLVRTTSTLTRAGGDTFAGVLSSLVRGVGGACNLLAEVLRALAVALEKHAIGVQYGNSTISTPPKLGNVSYGLSVHLLRLSSILNTLSSMYIWGGEITEALTSGLGEALEDSFQGLEIVLGSSDTVIKYLLNETIKEIRPQDYVVTRDIVGEFLRKNFSALFDRSRRREDLSAAKTALYEYHPDDLNHTVPSFDEPLTLEPLEEPDLDPSSSSTDSTMNEKETSWDLIEWGFELLTEMLEYIFSAVRPLLDAVEAVVSSYFPAVKSMLSYFRSTLPPLRLNVASPASSLVLLPHCLAISMYIYSGSYSLKSTALLLYVLYWQQYALHRLVDITSMHALHHQIRHESARTMIDQRKSFPFSLPNTRNDVAHWVNTLFTAMWIVDGNVANPVPADVLPYVDIFDQLSQLGHGNSENLSAASDRDNRSNIAQYLSARGGLGPYMSYVYRDMLVEQLALVPPSVANLRLKSFSLGSHPPLLYGINLTRHRNESCDAQHSMHFGGSGRADFKQRPSVTLLSSLLDRFFPRNASSPHGFGFGPHNGSIDSAPWSPCDLLVLSLDFVFISQELDVELTLRPPETKNALLPEMTAVIPRIALQGRLCFNMSLSPDFPFLNIAEV